LFDQGRFLDAESELRGALAAGESSGHLHALLGLCLRHAELHEAAKEEVLKALEVEPQCAYAHYALSYVQQGGIRANLFSVSASIKHVRRALEIEPYEVRYLVRLAELYQAGQEWKKSLEPLDAALRIAPLHMGAAVLRADGLIHTGRRAEALETLHRALETDPEASMAHAGMGWALLRAGDRNGATEFFDEALRLRPGSKWAQEGALECAKHHYWLYRVLSYPVQRFPGRPLLKLFIETGAITILLVAVLGLLTWLGPVLGRYIGEGGVVLIFMPLLLASIGLLFYKDPLFFWLVRRHRAAQSSEGLERRKRTERYIFVFIVGAIGGLLPIVLEKQRLALMMGIYGLVPGAICLWISLWETPAVAGRKWMTVYSVALVVAGCVTAIIYRDYLDELGRGAVMLLVLPVIPIAIANDRFKRKERERQHQREIETSRRKFDPA
jgi:Tfp pilus assembly protein PilF